MSSPLQFYRKLKALFAEHGLRAILTSGMACVEYGIQETTKDTDWIIHPDDLEKFVALLCQQEKGLSGANWRVSYRSLFGAPLDAEYHRGGWTSHLAIHDEPLSPEHHVDIFGQPPRLTIEAAFEGAVEGIASSCVVAQMKKTDRDKDWPSVNALGLRSWFSNDPEGILHIREPKILVEAWNTLPPEEQGRRIKVRPILALVSADNWDTLERHLLIEQTLWANINRERYGIYQQAWKEFYRKWQKDRVGDWPTSEPFAAQHSRVLDAARQYGLPPAPLASSETKTEIYRRAVERTSKLLSASREEIQQVLAPITETLP